MNSIIRNETINPIAIIRRYYQNDKSLFDLLIEHSLLVAETARSIARKIGANDLFVYEAALLHDIGIKWTNAPAIGCTGELPYLCHGVKGREILEIEGLPLHALICERHIGIGLTAIEIETQNLPLPKRDMLPQTVEEEIIAYADLFYSKNIRDRHRMKSAQEVRESLIQYGAEKGPIFDHMHQRFG